ncbi:unnamed protein product, partial [Ixodes hexagonus]
GRPPPIVTWWRGSTLVDEEFVTTPLDVVRNELVIKRLQRADLLATFTCQASNTNLTLPRSSSVTINMNRECAPSREPLRISGQAKGKRSSFCADRCGEKSWWASHERTLLYRERDARKIFGDLCIPRESLTKKGTSCPVRADLPTGFGMFGMALRVSHVPRLSLSLGANMKHKAIREGSDVYFECNIQANPMVSDVGWKFEGKPLYSNIKQGVIVSNQSLVLQKVRKESRGHYQCVAANVEGEGESDRVPLRVHYTPVCKKRQNLVYGVARDEEAEISCEVEADPGELSFKWALNNSVETFDVKTFVVNGTASVATYRPRWKHSYGLLYCWAQNSIGVQREPCAFHIIPAGEPLTRDESAATCLRARLPTPYLKVHLRASLPGSITKYFDKIFTISLPWLQKNRTKNKGSVYSAGSRQNNVSKILPAVRTYPETRPHGVFSAAGTPKAKRRRTRPWPPEAVKNCQVGNQTVTSLSVDCEPGDHGGLRQTFHLEVYNSALELLQKNLSSADGATFTVRDLPPGTAFILVLYGSNSKGRSNSVSISTNTLPSPERRTANTDITTVSPVLGVLIGIVGALVLVAIVIVVVMRLRGDDTEKRPTEDSPEKSQNHQRKATDDLTLTDLDTKDPSVIQKTTDSQEYPRVAVRRIPAYTTHRTYDSFSPNDYNYENIQSLRRPSPVKMDNEVRYAELSLPRSKYPVRIREPPTEYAQIDFQRAGVLFSTGQPPEHEEDDPCAVTSETPLMNNMQPNARHLSGTSSDHNTISTPV